jgi:hypothetical protein
VVTTKAFPHRGKAWLPLWGSCRRRRLRGQLGSFPVSRGRGTIALIGGGFVCFEGDGGGGSLPSSTGFAGPPSALRHGCAHPVGEGLVPPHPPPFSRFVLAQPSITAVPLPPSSGTSASNAGSLPACGEGSRRGAFPTGHSQRSIPSAVKQHFRQRYWLPARKKRGRFQTWCNAIRKPPT